MRRQGLALPCLYPDSGGARGPSVAAQRADMTPSEVVTEQDQCIGQGLLDVARWCSTVFFPLVMMSETGTMIVDSPRMFERHLFDLQQTALLRGVVGFRTRITSESQPAVNVAIVGSLRDHYDAAGHAVGTTSITWSLVRTDGVWKINQIHFNDTRHDPSVVSEMAHDMPEGS